MEKISVDVVIPTYNRATLIKRSIESILNQTVSCSKIIVVDDGSTDDTESVVNSLNDSRITYFKNEINRGANYCRNIGIKLSDADFIAFNDSDDVWMPNKLETQIKYLRDNLQDGGVFSPYHLVDDDKTVTVGRCTKEDFKDFYRRLLDENVIGTPTLLLRKSAIQTIGLFDESMPRMQDWEFCLRLARKCSVGYIDEPLVTAYRSTDSLSNSSYKALKAYKIMVEKYKDDIIKKGLVDNWYTKCICTIKGNKDNIAEVKMLVDTLVSGEANAFLYSRLFDRDTRIIKLDYYFDLALQMTTYRDYINTSLKEAGYKKIAIYGCSKIGNTFEKVIREGGFEVVSFIDRNQSMKETVPVVTYEEFLRNPNADIVINTVMELEEVVSGLFGEIKVVNLVDLLKFK